MKRSIALILTLLLLVLLCACGKTGSAEVNLGDSELYSENELMDAVDVVMDAFENGFSGCTLLTVEYDEEYTLREAELREKHYGKETVLVLLTDFYVSLDALAVGPLNPGGVCRDYQWILTRDALGRWILQDSGYG